MSNSDYIPQKDGKFLEWVKFLFTYVIAHAPAWGLNPATWADILLVIAEYETAYAKSQDPNRGKADVKAKNTVRDRLKKLVRQFVKEFLEYNSLISDEERERMGLPVHKTTRTPSEIAKDAPDSDINTSVPGRVTINFFEHGSDHKKAKPAGQHGAEIGWVISDVPPAKWSDLIHSAIDTNSPFTLEFENNQRGKTVYFALRWENTRGEKGPWSIMQNVVIP
jgi:hypothetical protein